MGTDDYPFPSARMPMSNCDDITGLEKIKYKGMCMDEKEYERTRIIASSGVDISLEDLFCSRKYEWGEDGSIG